MPESSRDGATPVVPAGEHRPASSSTTIVVRPAEPRDRDSLLAMHRALYREYGATIVTPALAPLFAYHDLETTLRDDMDAMLESPASVVFIASRADAVAGYITGLIDDDPRRVCARCGTVQDWYVRPEHRAHGVGRALLHHLVGRFREARCQSVESRTWWGNQGAMSAHERLGFERIEVRYGLVLTDPSGGLRTSLDGRPAADPDR